MQQHMREADEANARQAATEMEEARHVRYNQADLLTLSLLEIEMSAGLKRPSGKGQSQLGRLTKTIECISCTSERPAIWSMRTSCGHDYCSKCVATLFANATREEDLFPPRCC